MCDTMNLGINNEFQFIKYFNGKKIKELSPLHKELIDFLFPFSQNESIIKCWRNHQKQKTDVFFKINNQIRGISLKLGSRNSVHAESIQTFCKFLYENGASKNLIKDFLKYHYADGTCNRKGEKRLSCTEYKALHQKSIDKINQFLNTEPIINNAIERFVIKGNNSKYEIDALVYGTITDFLWISKKEIKDIILENANLYCSGIHFSSLICQPLHRCLNNNQKLTNRRHYIQIKWYRLFDDILLCMTKRIQQTNLKTPNHDPEI